MIVLTLLIALLFQSVEASDNETDGSTSSSSVVGYSQMLDELDQLFAQAQSRQATKPDTTTASGAVSDLQAIILGRINSSNYVLSEAANLYRAILQMDTPEPQRTNAFFHMHVKFSKAFKSTPSENQHTIHRLWHEFSREFPFTREDAQHLHNITNVGRCLFDLVCPPHEESSNLDERPLPENSRTPSPTGSCAVLCRAPSLSSTLGSTSSLRRTGSLASLPINSIISAQ